MEVLINDEVFLFKNSKLQNNSYVIINKKAAIVIDPSWNSDEIINFLYKKKILSVVVFLTHAHYDHVAEIDKIKNVFPKTKFFISKHESIYLKKSSSNPIYKCPIIIPKEDIIEIKDSNSVFHINQITINTFYNPGHSKGSTSYIYKNLIFTGDFIFSNCIGRTDLEGGNLIDMSKSLNKFFKIADDQMVICPGHNETSLFKIVRAYNDEMENYSK